VKVISTIIVRITLYNECTSLCTDVYLLSNQICYAEMPINYCSMEKRVAIVSFLEIAMLWKKHQHSLCAPVTVQKYLYTSISTVTVACSNNIRVVPNPYSLVQRGGGCVVRNGRVCPSIQQESYKLVPPCIYCTVQRSATYRALHERLTYMYICNIANVRYSCVYILSPQLEC